MRVVFDSILEKIRINTKKKETRHLTHICQHAACLAFDPRANMYENNNTNY